MVVRRIVVALGLLGTSLSCIALDDFGSVLDSYVFTPSRMDQAIKDVPGAISVIDGETIRKLGIKHIPEIFRLVPGFNVEYTGSYTFVNRGSNVPTGRRLQVLIDGVSEVSPLVGVIHYEVLPVALESIDKVEVIRSQSTSTYGANSFYGVINFITKHPKDRETVTLSGRASNRGWDAYAAYGAAISSTDLVLDFKSMTYDRYDTFKDSDTELHDDLDVQKVSLRTTTKLDDGSELKMSLSGTVGSLEYHSGQTIYGLNYPVPRMQSWVASFDYEVTSESHVTNFAGYMYDKDVDYSWDVCGMKALFYPELGELYRDNPALVSSVFGGGGLAPGTASEFVRLLDIVTFLNSDPTSNDIVCGTANIDFRYRTNFFELRDIWQLNELLRLSSGLQIDSKSMESEAYGNGTTSLDKFKALSNLEYLGIGYTINAGVFVESLDLDMDATEFSPKIGLNLHLDEYTTLKIIHSKGSRLIDGIEVVEDHTIPTKFSNDVYGKRTQSAFFAYLPVYRDKGHVEKITSTEVIYYVEDRSGSSDLELRGYIEDLSNILNFQHVSLYLPEAISRQGVEIVYGKTFSRFNFRAMGYYLDSSSDVEGYGNYSLYGGSLYAIVDLGNQYTFSTSYYMTSEYLLPPDRQFDQYNRVDIRLGKKWGDSIDVEAIMSYHDDDYERPDSTPGQIDTAERDQNIEVTLGMLINF